MSENAVDKAAVSNAAPAAEAGPQGGREGAGRPDHMRLWDRLKRTDPRATKPFQRAGGFRGTQIDPVWRQQIMTEAFGPVGQGWGYEQLDWTIAEGMVFICVRVWYRDPETGEVFWTGPQWGGTEMRRRRRDGTDAPDDECFKMSITDALGKCLVQLGLGADIHMGQFDDSKYQREVEAYYAAKDRPELKPVMIERFEAEVRGQLAAVVADLDQLDELWRSGVGARLRDVAMVDPAASQRIIEAFSRRKAELQGRGDGEPGGQGNGAGRRAPGTAPEKPAGQKPYKLRELADGGVSEWMHPEDYLHALAQAAAKLTRPDEVANWLRANDDEMARAERAAGGRLPQRFQEFRASQEGRLAAR